VLHSALGRAVEKLLESGKLNADGEQMARAFLNA